MGGEWRIQSTYQRARNRRSLICFSMNRILFLIGLLIYLRRSHSEESLHWADYLFNRQPEKLSYWKYEIDYRGRSGSIEKW
jgi:hypothetical protein